MVIVWLLHTIFRLELTHWSTNGHIALKRTSRKALLRLYYSIRLEFFEICFPRLFSYASKNVPYQRQSVHLAEILRRSLLLKGLNQSPLTLDKEIPQESARDLWRHC